MIRRRKKRDGGANHDSATDTRPDAVAGTSGRRTVTIVDDGLSDAVVLGAFDDTGDGAVTPPPARTAMDPRIRDRRREVRRTQGRRRRRILLVVAVVVLVAVAALVVLVSPVLSIRQVDIDGAVYSRRFDSERLEQVEASLRGSPILSVDLAEARAELEASPWIRSVRITRDLPSRVIIEIEERQPLAWFAGSDGRFRVIDADAVVIAVLDGQPIEYLGIAAAVAPDLEAGEAAPGSLRAAAQLIRSLPDEVARLVTALAVSEVGELSMTLTSGTEVRFGLPDDLQGKLVALVVVLRRQDVADLRVIDLASGQPTVR
jgi:cell division protein FtsQ